MSPLVQRNSKCNSPALFTLQGHTEYVTSVAFSPDGLTLASGSNDHTLKLWDRNGGRLRLTLSGHTGGVKSVAFSPDGRILASGSNDKTIKIWDLVSGTLLRTFEGHTDAVLSIAFSLDGKTLASGSTDETIRLWSTSKSRPIRAMQGNCGSVPKIAFSPDGRILASSSGDWKQPIKFWDVKSGQEVCSLASSRVDVVTSIAYSNNGHTLASGNWGGVTIKLWDTVSGELVGTLPGHNGLVYSLAFSPDRRILASASRDKTIKLWNLGDVFI